MKPEQLGEGEEVDARAEDGAEPRPEPGAPVSDPAPGDPSPAPEPRAFALGDRVEGVVAQLEPLALLELSGGRRARIDAAELTAEPVLGLGDAVEAFVIRDTPEGELWVSRTIASGSAAFVLLKDAQERALPVEGRVVAQGPQGLDVDLGAGVIALCPTAEVDVRPVENPGHLVGQSLRFRVLQVDGSRVTLSRRALLEAEAGDVADVRTKLLPGAVLKGRVTSLREFGAFVNLGGIEGLIHLSEISHQRISHPSEVLHVGEEIEVRVLKFDYVPGKGERLSLSRKALEPSAWEKATAEIAVGQKRKGKVLRLQPFGAFVELLPGVDGLIHISEMGARRRSHPNEILKEGDEVEVEVLGIDPDRKRIALRRQPTPEEAAALKAERQAKREEKRAEARVKREKVKEKRDELKAKRARARLKPHERLKPGDVVACTVDRVESYGLFVEIEGGGRGMIHHSELGLPKKTDLAVEFPKGAKLEAAVLEVSPPPNPRIRLSKSAVERLAAGETVEHYLKARKEDVQVQELAAAAERALRPAKHRPARSGRPPSAHIESERPRGPPAERNRGPGGPKGTPLVQAKAKPGGLGTFADLFKDKLAAKKR
jgi:small subunit ribosomal protein S1